MLAFGILLTRLADGACPSTQAGFGSQVQDHGVTFRVWAPHADSVSVAGSFNGWSRAADPLCREDAGVWSADVTHAAAGDEYRYVITRGEQVLWRKDPCALQVVNSSGNSQVYDPRAFAWSDAAWTPPGRNRTVLYELHVGTFHDPQPDDRRPATFADAAVRLNYLAELGINHLSLMPVAEFPGDCSWGYNPSDPYAVESHYGGPAAFQAFVDACHGQGLAASLDIVHNHWGPGDLHLWRFDGWSRDGFGGIYFYNDARGQTTWGSRPDYGRPEVRDYIRGNALMWIRDYHLDGLRWDSTIAMRNARAWNLNPENDIPDAWRLLQEANRALDALRPATLSMAEDMAQNDWLTKQVDEGGAGFDAQWDSGFVHPVRAALETPWDGERDMEAVRRALAGSYNGDPFQRIIFTESHDEVANGRQRVPSSIEHTNAAGYWARKRSTLGAGLLFTAPGIPMIFQGQEFLENGWFSDSHPLDWSKTNTQAGTLRLYQDLISLRKNTAGSTRGLTGAHLNIHHVNGDAKLMAYHRWDQGGPGDDVVVVANFAHRTWGVTNTYRIGFPRAGRWTGRFNSDLARYGPDYDNVGADQSIETEPLPYDGLPASATVAIGPYSVLVLSQ